MAKVWKDANEAIKMIHDIEDSKLRELDIEMRKKPKFDKYKKKEGNYRIKQNYMFYGGGR